jgi:hypothetical protein
MRVASMLVALLALGCIGGAAVSAPAPCAIALRTGTVCMAAGEEARRLLAERKLAGAIVIEDVQSGSVLVASSTPNGIGDGTAISPLSMA